MYQITKKYGTSNIVDFLNEIDRYSIGMDGMINRLITAPETNSNYPPYNYINLAIFFISKVDIILFTSKNCLPSTVNMQI